MNQKEKISFWRKLHNLIIGRARNPFDANVFHSLSLVAFFAWVGLGADGLSSVCYGPEEAFKALEHRYVLSESEMTPELRLALTNGSIPEELTVQSDGSQLEIVKQRNGQALIERVVSFHRMTIFIAIATAITIFVISTSYIQIIENFPSGGGGYLVASKLLRPELGMVCGCALVLDYVLTIAISIASGADFLLSYVPTEVVWQGMSFHPHALKLPLIVAALGVLTIMNLRGVKESVAPLVPIFVTFLIAHVAVIVAAPIINWSTIPQVAQGTIHEVKMAVQDPSMKVGQGWVGAQWAGLIGMAIMLLRAYSMGAGSYTGIEAVSNGMPILREPKVETGKQTMRYMAFSLAVTVVGLMIAYLLYSVQPETGKTLNAVLFNKFTAGWGESGTWGHWAGRVFVATALTSSAAILFVAAQAGFLAGPRVLSNMALDRWVPHRFATLSDRLVTDNGVLLMAGSALATLILTAGSVDILVILYSINVFITFSLSQAGMVRLWWQKRGTPEGSRSGLAINLTGLILCLFILCATIALKFGEGGWLTLLITLGFIVIVVLIRRHYRHTHKLLDRLNALVRAAESSPPRHDPGSPPPAYDPNAKTAVLVVNGFNGLGLHTLFSIVRLFGGVFKNFVVVNVGLIDQGNFKGVGELGHLGEHCKEEIDKYVNYLTKEGYYAEGHYSVGLDIVDEIAKLAPDMLNKFPGAVFFGGQLVFPNETMVTRWLHNNTVFSLQRRFYNQGIPVVVLPIRV